MSKVIELFFFSQLHLQLVFRQYIIGAKDNQCVCVVKSYDADSCYMIQIETSNKKYPENS